MYLGIIPARGGSKGVPGKNYSSLGGIPLIQWTIDSSLKATGLDDIICTSDCQIIQDIAVMNKIKFLQRPDYLSSDTSPIIETIKYVINNYKDRKVTHIVLLQPTSPFRKPETISQCIEISKRRRCNTVITAYSSTHCHPSLIFNVDDNTHEPKWLLQEELTKRRQDLSKYYIRAGTCYVTDIDTILSCSSIYGKVVSFKEVSGIETINIDTQADLDLANYYAASL